MNTVGVIIKTDQQPVTPGFMTPLERQEYPNFIHVNIVKRNEEVILSFFGKGDFGNQKLFAYIKEI